MQLMSWTVARLGSRLGLLLEPYKRRVMHSALGRHLDKPLDLRVGLIEPDGVQRVLPLSSRGELLSNLEQFERVNSITYRGYSERYRLRFEFNIHSVFYPQEEQLCILPALYLEVRINPSGPVRWTQPAAATPDKVRLFIELDRPDTQISASEQGGVGRIDLAYRNSLVPHDVQPLNFDAGDPQQTVAVSERIVSLNNGCLVLPGGKGLTLELPVSDVGSGIKWRLVWGAWCGDPVLTVQNNGQQQAARFRYTRHWSNLDQVMEHAIGHRDEYLARSRRFDKLFDQSSLRPAQRHLINHGFQTLLSNTFWCDLPDGQMWFSNWEGNTCLHSSIDTEYNVSLLYLTLWPMLLSTQFGQWAQRTRPHQRSNGCYLAHDLGFGMRATGQALPFDMPVEGNTSFLLMLQAYAHWTGDLEPVRQHADLIEKLANYLAWTDRDASGFPSEGLASTVVDAGPAASYARKQTYLAIKRLTGLNAAADLLMHAGRDDASRRLGQLVETDPARIEAEAWLGDHYAVCVDRTAAGLKDVWTGKAVPSEEVPGWDGYSIFTANGLLLPVMAGQGCLLDQHRLQADVRNSARETLGQYGCSHTTVDADQVWVSQNLWRDLLQRYIDPMNLGLGMSERYWDLQVMSNTHSQSMGFADSYVGNNLAFYSRGVAAIGYMLSHPRLMIDRLAAGGQRICVEPDRHRVQRWPLLPLADWKAGKIPVCVVNANGRVVIESESDPVIIRGSESQTAQLIG